MTSSIYISDSEDWADIAFHNEMVKSQSKESYESLSWEILSHIPARNEPNVSQTLNANEENADDFSDDFSNENSVHLLESFSMESLMNHQISIESSISENIEQQSKMNNDIMIFPEISENNEWNDNRFEITSYGDIVQELENQRAIVTELRNNLRNVSNERDQAFEIISELKTNQLLNELEIRHLISLNVRRLQLNTNIQRKRKSYKKSGRKVRSKKNSLSNKTGYHQPYTVGQLEFDVCKSRHFLFDELQESSNSKSVEFINHRILKPRICRIIIPKIYEKKSKI